MQPAQDSAFSEADTKARGRVDSVGDDTITSTTNDKANSKPIAKPTSKQPGTSIRPVVKAEVPLVFTRRITPPQQCAQQAHSSSGPPHPSPLSARLPDPIQPPANKSSPGPHSSASKALPGKEEEETYEKLGSSALLEGSVPDFTPTGHQWRDSCRGVDSEAVRRYFSSRYRRRVYGSVREQ